MNRPIIVLLFFCLFTPVLQAKAYKPKITGHWIILTDTIFTLGELAENNRTLTLMRKTYNEKQYKWGGAAKTGVAFNEDGSFSFLSNVMCSTESSPVSGNGSWTLSNEKNISIQFTEATYSLKIISSTKKKMVATFESVEHKPVIVYAKSNDSIDQVLVTKYLFDKHQAVKAYTSRSRNNLLNQWEEGPFKITSPEIEQSLKPGWRVYGVCSYAHGIPSPHFKMTLFIDERDSIYELKYDEVELFNKALRNERKAGDVKTMSLAIMTILTAQSCILAEMRKDRLSMTKSKEKYSCKIEIGHGYRVEKDPAYWWWVEFDTKLNCTKAWFRADLPPVP